LLPDHIILEACVGTVEASIKAEKNGAHQLELCGRLDLDGLTPDISLIQAVRAAVDIPIKVMLRNRGGDFVYTNEDIDEMKSSLPELLNQDIQGIVFGALLPDGTINIPLTNEICTLAGDLPVTFHKAIDVAEKILAATKELKQTDIKEILTSGGMPTAAEGKTTIKQMIEIADGQFTIMSAGKVTNQNIEALQQSIGGTHFHGKRIVG